MLVSNVPLTALGIGTLILGLSVLMTPSAPVPGEAIRALIEGATMNIEAILEEFGVSSRGYYVAHEDGRVYVYIPISGGDSPPREVKPPEGVLVEEDGRIYLVLLPPTSEVVKLEEVELETGMEEVLVSFTELCESVRVSEGRRIVVEMRGPRGHIGAVRFKRSLGSIEGGIAACVAAKVLKRPVRIESERDKDGVRYVTLEVY